jgi:Immune Mapped Protein 2 (IMP2) N-terminal domain
MSEEVQQQPPLPSVESFVSEEDLLDWIDDDAQDEHELRQVLKYLVLLNASAVHKAIRYVQRGKQRQHKRQQNLNHEGSVTTVSLYSVPNSIRLEQKAPPLQQPIEPPPLKRELPPPQQELQYEDSVAKANVETTAATTSSNNANPQTVTNIASMESNPIPPTTGSAAKVPLGVLKQQQQSYPKQLLVLCTSKPSSRKEGEDQDKAMQICRQAAVLPYIVLKESKPQLADELLQTSNLSYYPQFFLKANTFHTSQMEEDNDVPFFLGDYDTVQRLHHQGEFNAKMLLEPVIPTPSAAVVTPAAELSSTAPPDTPPDSPIPERQHQHQTELVLPASSPLRTQSSSSLPSSSSASILEHLVVPAVPSPPLPPSPSPPSPFDQPKGLHQSISPENDECDRVVVAGQTLFDPPEAPPSARSTPAAPQNAMKQAQQERDMLQSIQHQPPLMPPSAAPNVYPQIRDPLPSLVAYGRAPSPPPSASVTYAPVIAPVRAPSPPPPVLVPHPSIPAPSPPVDTHVHIPLHAPLVPPSNDADVESFIPCTPGFPSETDTLKPVGSSIVTSRSRPSGHEEEKEDYTYSSSTHPHPLSPSKMAPAAAVRGAVANQWSPTKTSTSPGRIQISPSILNVASPREQESPDWIIPSDKRTSQWMKVYESQTEDEEEEAVNYPKQSAPPPSSSRQSVLDTRSTNTTADRNWKSNAQTKSSEPVKVANTRTTANDRSCKDKTRPTSPKRPMDWDQNFLYPKGGACYLVFDHEQAELNIYYSEVPLIGSVGVWTTPHIKAFKEAQGLGQSEMIGNCARGVVNDKQQYCHGWCQFIMAAKSMEATVMILDVGFPVDFHLYVDGQTQLVQKGNFETEMMDAVACLPKDTEMSGTLKGKKWIKAAKRFGAVALFRSLSVRDGTDSHLPHTPSTMGGSPSTPSRLPLAHERSSPHLPIPSSLSSSPVVAKQPPSPPPAAPSPAVTFEGDGYCSAMDAPNPPGGACYLLYETDSSGRLVEHYSRNPIQDAIGRWVPAGSKKMPGFKFTQNLGRSVLIGNCSAGVQGRKNYSSGWCQFVRSARVMEAEVMIWDPVAKGLMVDVYLYQDDPRPTHQTVKLLPGVAQGVGNALAVACIPKKTPFYEGMCVDILKWLADGSNYGASSRF